MRADRKLILSPRLIDNPSVSLDRGARPNCLWAPWKAGWKKRPSAQVRIFGRVRLEAQANEGASSRPLQILERSCRARMSRSPNWKLGISETVGDI